MGITIAMFDYERGWFYRHMNAGILQTFAWCQKILVDFRAKYGHKFSVAADMVGDTWYLNGFQMHPENTADRFHLVAHPN